MTTPMALPFLSTRPPRAAHVPRWHELRMVTITREDPSREEDESDEKTPVRIALRDLAW